MQRLGLFALLIFAAALTRVVPHWPNCTLINASALFAGAYFSKRWMALLVPLLAMSISDVGLELIHRLELYQTGWLVHGSGFYSGIWTVYASVAIVSCLGFALRKNRSIMPVSLCAAGSALIFWVLTNFGYWAFSADSDYHHTWAGLMQCYVAAIPFLGWQVTGDAVYSIVLFGGYALVQKRSPQFQPAAVQS